MGAAALKFLKIGKLNIFGTDSSGGWGEPLQQNANDAKLVDKYLSHVWAYRGINTIAKTAASVPLKVVSDSRDGKPKEERGHRLIELIENPNEFMTRVELVELLMIFLESTGDGFWLFDDGSENGRRENVPMKLREVKEIWPLFSQFMTPLQGKSAPIRAYNYKPNGSGKGETYSVAEVFHARYSNPISLVDGLGSLQAAYQDILGDTFSQKFKNFILRNVATNAVFLKTDGSLTNDQREIYKRSLGSVFKGVRLGFMESGLDFALPQIAPKDLPILEMDKAAQRRVLGALGVPPLLVGSEDAKYDNAEQQLRIFWGHEMIPKFSKIEGALTKKLHALGEDKRLRVIFDLSGVKELQADQKVQAETAKVWVDLGYPLNSAIKVFGVQGMEDVEGGDVGLVSTSLIPLLDLLEGPEEPLDPEGTPIDAPPAKPGEKPKKPAADEEPEPEEEKGSPAPERSLQAAVRGAAHDKALDDAHWKRFMGQNEPIVRRLRAELRRQFKRQEKSVQARIVELFGEKDLADLKLKSLSTGFSTIRDARVELVLFDLQIETEKFAKATRPILKAIYDKLGKQAITDLAIDGISFDIGSPAALNFLNGHVPRFSFDVNKSTRDALREAISEKIASGSTQADLSEAVANVFDMAKGYRSARIARTETAIAGNSGIIDGLKQAGVEAKRWISSRDEKVRDSHANADGQEVPIGEAFDVGGYFLKYPGDPEGPASEIVNCRCVVRAAKVKA